MNMDRRNFLFTVGSAAIASLLYPGRVFAELAVDPSTVLGRDYFAARIREWFYLHNADATHQGNLQLTRIKDENSSQQVEQFALMLRSHRGALPLPSGYYEVAGEPFSLFVKHTHERRGRQFYRAEFALLQQQ